MSDEPPLTPRALFAPSELEAMERILWGYSHYLQKAPTSAKNTTKIEVLERIRGRLVAQLTSRGAQDIELLLDIEELEALLEALLEFVKLIKQLTPKTQPRDEMLAEVHAMRLRLIHIISEFNV